MKIIFFGSDDFAQAHLKALLGSGHEVLACVTQPDRPKGRGMAVTTSPIKECALKSRIPLLQPEALNNPSFTKNLKDLHSDIFVVIAYGKFLPSAILKIPSCGAINVHASLLPKYRGAAPMNWAIMKGEKETGISIILLNEEMDAGDILAQRKVKIDPEETALTLRVKIMKESPPFLLKTLNQLSDCPRQVQDHKGVTFAPKLTKEMGRIEWGRQGREICALIRGLVPWPGAYTFYKGKLLKVLEAQVLDRDLSENEPGVILEISKKGIVVSTGDGKVLIQKVHLQDAKPMDAHSFVIGHKVEVGYEFK